MILMKEFVSITMVVKGTGKSHVSSIIKTVTKKKNVSSKS